MVMLVVAAKGEEMFRINGRQEEFCNEEEMAGTFGAIYASHEADVQYIIWCFQRRLAL